MTSSTPPIRVLVAEDNAFFRLTVSTLLEQEPDIVVVGQASSGEEAIALATTLRPDIVIMDLGLPGIDGARATQDVLRFASPAQVIVLSGSSIEEGEAQALLAGAIAYLTKDEAGTRLVPEVRAAVHH